MKRRFRGLREPPARRYDAVVIGGGIGGLLTGLLLARDGRRVLLVEQHYMLGGYCSTFRRAGYTFDAGTHFYPLLGNPSTWPGHLLQELGVTTRWLKMDPVDTFHFPDGDRFDVPADFETYRRLLAERFPEQQEALDGFFQEVRDAYLVGLLFYFRGRRTRRVSLYEDVSLRQALDRHFDDPRLKLLLTADCPHWGSSPEQTSYLFDSMLRLSYFLGNYYPEGGSQGFADELGRRFEELGGDLMMSTRAERVDIVDGGVRGVELETLRGGLRGRHRVACDTVIANGDLRDAYARLLPPELSTSRQAQQLKNLEPSFPCFLTHIGLRDVDPADLERVQGYYWNGWDPERVGRNGLRCKIFSPTLFDPGLAPKGGQIVILQKVQEIDFAAISGRADGEEMQMRWHRHKQQVEDYVFAHLCKVIPGIEDKVVVKLSASAHTSWRFTLNAQGAMLGWRMSPEQLGDRRPDIEGPASGLYFVGHWVRPGGGIVPVMASAVRVASRLGAASDSALSMATVS